MHFAGIDWGRNNVVFLFDDPIQRVRHVYAPLGKTFTLSCEPNRYCVGSYDLETLQSFPCPHAYLLESDSRELMCPDCRKRSGFNPAFYHADSISLQQQRYNQQPHSVYLAWFSPGVVKVGIALARRLETRLKEQGARYAVVIAECDNAYDARALEERMVSSFSIKERITEKEKELYICRGMIDISAAQAEVIQYANDLRVEIVKEYASLSDIYFYEPIDFALLSTTKGADRSFVAGRCVAVIGTIAIMQQKTDYYTVPLKPFVSHEIVVEFNSCSWHYVSENKQMPLW